MFDSPYSTWTGGSAINNTNKTGITGYPNPCGANTTLRFEIQKTENVKISVCNLAGQPVAFITDQPYTTGNHEVKCNVGNLSSGSYIIQLMAGDFRATTRLVVIR
jgi:hypothetical protein